MRRLLPLLLVLLLGACAPASPAAEPVTLAAGGASDVTLARDARSGTSYAAWIGSDGHAADVYLASSPDGERWSAPVRVNHLPGDAAAHEQAPPQVAVGADGSVLVVWQTARAVPGRRFVASDLRLARSTDGGRSFAPAIFVNDDAGGPPSSHTFHDVTVAPDGTVLVSWIDGRRRDAARAALAATGGEHAHHGAEAGLPLSEVRIARSRNGGSSFEPPAIVSRTSCPCCRTALVAGAGGRVHVAFRRIAEDGTRDIHVATSADGGATFGEPVRVHADRWKIDGCPHAGAALALAADGRLHVAWYTGAGEHPGLYHASSRDGARFTPPVPLLAAAYMPPAHVRAGADERGTWLAWDDRRTAERRISVARTGTGGRTRAEIMLSGSTPAIAAAGDGVLLAWQDSGAVRVLRLDPG